MPLPVKLRVTILAGNVSVLPTKVFLYGLETGVDPSALDLCGAKLDVEDAVLLARCLGAEVDGLAIRRAQPSTRGAVY